MNKFEVGATYAAHSAASSTWRPLYTVIARTAKFITIEDAYGKVVRVGVKFWDGEEYSKPLGSYSLAPIMRPSRKVVTA